MYKVRACGFDGKGSVSCSDWVPSGTYLFRGGMSFPTRRFKGGSNRMEGCFIWCGYRDGKVYLMDCCIWNEISEVVDFFSRELFEGFKLRLFTAESDVDVWRNLLKFSDLDRSHKPLPFYLHKVDDAKLLDCVLRWMNLGRLKFERGSVFYKQLGLFLTNPHLEINPFLESLGYLLIGMETYYGKQSVA